MGDQRDAYVSMMVDSLRKKQGILEYLLAKTREQEILLKDDEMDMDRFQAIIEEKGQKIDELGKIDEGFDALFRHVEREIKSNRMAYKDQIQTMQKLIQRVSELGIQIQALEQQNSGHFKVYLANQRKNIREKRMNNKTAADYYQNMANVHKPEQSYFFNETK